jgi:hypothetical protein
LYSLSQVITPSLLLDDELEDLSRGDVIVTTEGDVEVTLIVTKIEVYLGAI